MKFSPHLAKARGVTLLEVLAVVVIMGVLAVLLLPASQSLMQAGQKGKCVSNLRSIHLALLAFVEDYDGKLPPALGVPGETTIIDSRYNLEQFWWGQAYLGPYAVGPLDRKRDGRGAFSQKEVEIYNCPARFQDGPDSKYAQMTGANPKPRVSYVMAKLPNTPLSYRYMNMDNKSKKVFLTEGRSSTVWNANCKTGAFGTSNVNRLRRYHNGALNVLFYDGHVEAFGGKDEDLAAMLP